MAPLIENFPPKYQTHTPLPSAGTDTPFPLRPRPATLFSFPASADVLARDRLMGARRIRREQVRVDQNLSRRTNGMLKMYERERRLVRMTEIIKKGKLPYIPSVMSWLSAQLDKPSTRIVQADVDALLTPKAPA